MVKDAAALGHDRFDKKLGRPARLKRQELPRQNAIGQLLIERGPRRSLLTGRRRAARHQLPRLSDQVSGPPIGQRVAVGREALRVEVC